MKAKGLKEDRKGVNLQRKDHQIREEKEPFIGRIQPFHEYIEEDFPLGIPKI